MNVKIFIEDRKHYVRFSGVKNGIYELSSPDRIERSITFRESSRGSEPSIVFCASIPNSDHAHYIVLECNYEEEFVGEQHYCDVKLSEIRKLQDKVKSGGAHIGPEIENILNKYNY